MLVIKHQQVIFIILFIIIIIIIIFNAINIIIIIIITINIIIGGIASKSAKSIVEVVNSGCTYYSHETNYRDYRFILNGNNGTAPYKFIRVFTIIRQPLDHAFSALGHYAR